MCAHTQGGRGGLGQIPQVISLIPTVDASAHSKKASGRLQQCMNLCACELCLLLPTTQSPLPNGQRRYVRSLSRNKLHVQRNELHIGMLSTMFSPLNSSQNWQIKHPALKSGHPDRRLQSLFQGTVDVVLFKYLYCLIEFHTIYLVHIQPNSSQNHPNFMLCLGSCLCFNYPLTSMVLPICSWMWSHHASMKKTDSSFPRSHQMPLIWSRAPEALQTPCWNAEWCVILHRDHSCYEVTRATVPPRPEDTVCSSPPAFDFLPLS